MDHDPLERKYQHSLDSSVASLNYKGMHLNLIDTAGIPDFRGTTLASLTAIETTAIVINAHSGIEMATRRLMRRAKQRRLCRMIIINRIDADDVDLTQIVKDLRAEFGPECLPVNLPAENLSKVRDCFFQTEGETDIFSLTEAHDAIIDQVVEVNEELMEKFLEGEDLTREDLHTAFEQALREGHLVPICFVSALTGAGIEELLDFFNQLAPSPREGNP
ncbi:MAG: elongation factor G, partial [Xanthomonadales bacterium]|nr:elongation factor G [Xanthomonadales bacterium]